MFGRFSWKKYVNNEIEKMKKDIRELEKDNRKFDAIIDALTKDDTNAKRIGYWVDCFGTYIYYEGQEYLIPKLYLSDGYTLTHFSGMTIKAERPDEDIYLIDLNRRSFVKIERTGEE